MSTYNPTEEACRKAPAFCCQIASRVLWMRQKLAKLKREKPDAKFSLHELEQILKPFCEPLPFEADLLSGDIERVNAVFEQSPEVNPNPNPEGEIALPEAREAILRHVHDSQKAALELLRT